MACYEKENVVDFTLAVGISWASRYPAYVTKARPSLHAFGAFVLIIKPLIRIAFLMATSSAGDFF
jgi:hypothetical protein